MTNNEDKSLNFNLRNVALFMCAVACIFTLYIVYIGVNTFGSDPSLLQIEYSQETNTAHNYYDSGACLKCQYLYSGDYKAELRKNIYKLEKINDFFKKLLAYFIVLMVTVINVCMAAVFKNGNN